MSRKNRKQATETSLLPTTELGSVVEEPVLPKNCSNCSYSHGPVTQGTLACTFNPPEFVGLGYGAATILPTVKGFSFARVLPDQLCGQYKESDRE
jgi:hypothetical protein